jgi:ankyrin repeat protein
MQDDARLCHAALEGDVSYLQGILQKDPNVLRCCMIHNSGSFMQSPLHIASKNGHLQFINVILQHSPQLATDIFQPYGENHNFIFTL